MAGVTPGQLERPGSPAVFGNFLTTVNLKIGSPTFFHECEIPETNSCENWIEAGRRDSLMRANAKWNETLRTCEPPPLDPSVDEALEAFMGKGKPSMPEIRH